jgi:ATP-dependent protease HslVU (ClpYQ) peptidase subunit
MSVIACRISENGYEIASDSITVRRYTQTKGQTSDFSKLFEVNNMVIGGVGRSEEISLFRLFLLTHNSFNSTEQSLLELLSEFSDWKNKKIDNPELENHYLIGVYNNVFCVEGWHIEKITSYMAIGAGQEYALSALYLGHSAEKAIETAIELSMYCEYPVIKINKIFDTKDNKK